MSEFENTIQDKHTRHSLVLWVLVVFIFSILVWASRYRIDQVVRGKGIVISSSRIQIIQTVDGGAIEKLFVKEGDYVEGGQILAVLDKTRAEAAVSELDAKLAALNAQAARLKAELAGSSIINFPDALLKFREVIAEENILFQKRRLSYNEEQRTLGIAVQLAREEAQLVAHLAQAGDVSRAEVIRAERALNEASAQKINRHNKYFQDAQIELVKAKDDIAQLEQVRAQRVQILTNCTLKAPVRGVVKNVRITTQGGVLRSGEDLMELVPIGEKLIVETRITPADIAMMQDGLTANIRFDPFDYTIYGAVLGTVSYISADSLTEEKVANPQSYYRVHVTIPGFPVKTQKGTEIDIIPGMTAQVDIRTGDRTVLEYLLKPIRKTLTESFGEK